MSKKSMSKNDKNVFFKSLMKGRHDLNDDSNKSEKNDNKKIVHYHNNSSGNSTNNNQKAIDQKKQSSKSKNKTKAVKTDAFTPNKTKHRIIYENIRVQYHVFKNIKKAQFANGIKSRSDLLQMMFDYCKPALFNSPKKRKRAKQMDKIISAEEKARKLSKK